MGISAEADDLNDTLLIGPEVTELTTTNGAIEAKRTSLVPDFASAMVRYYTQAGLNAGDTVAIGTSGSFPGLAIASIAAAGTMGLNIKVIASLGASMHGATRVEFNIFDILLALKESGVADFDLVAVSQGSTKDQGGGAWDGFYYEGTKALFREMCEETAAETGAVFIDCPDLGDSIRMRLELFGNVDLFVNVGGSGASNGTTTRILDVPAGLVTSFGNIPDDSTRGLVFEYLARGIPVVNLLNVRQLASDNGIAYDPVPMPEPGVSGVYMQTSYSAALIITGIICTLGILAAGVILSGRNRR
jgi:poly-gamma-glutamate system protein